MSTHTPTVVETMAADCYEQECEHINEMQDCPMTPMVVCEACTDMSGEDWSPVTEWPCLHAKHGPTDQQVKDTMIAEYVKAQETA